MALILRNEKGNELTHNEMDSNLVYLDEKTEQLKIHILVGGGILNVGGIINHITDSLKYFLPNSNEVGAELPAGTHIRVTKLLEVEPEIEVSDVLTYVIKTDKGNDTSVIFDINAEIIFIWNGIEWEI